MRNGDSMHPELEGQFSAGSQPGRCRDQRLRDQNPEANKHADLEAELERAK